MDFDKIAFAVSSLIAAYLAWKEYKHRQSQAPYERDEKVSSAVKNLSDALGLTSNELVESLTESAKLRDELAAVRSELATTKAETKIRVDETNKHRDEVDKKIEKLNREYAKEISALKAQIESWELRYNEIKDKYHRVVEFFVNYLKEKNEPIPADLALLLGDSIAKFKLRGEK